MNPNDIYRSFSERGLEWADKLGAAELLESALKSTLAQLTLEAQSAEGCSMAQAKDIALSSHTYRDYAVKAIEARTAANRAKVGYDSVKALFDAQRTAESTERAAMRAAT